MLPELNGQEARERIAKRLAAELQDGEVVNLGIGIPQLIPNFVSDDVRIILQTENGAILACQARDQHDLRVIDAGGKAISVLPGGSFIASDLSFALMRGGHVDVTVLGALQADQEGSLANWAVPGERMPGMGGAMDIVSGAKKVFVATRFFDKNGACKLVKKCSLPLTGRGCVNMIVTEYCVIKRENGRMVLTELATGADQRDIIAATGMELEICAELRNMENCFNGRTRSFTKS